MHNTLENVHLLDIFQIPGAVSPAYGPATIQCRIQDILGVQNNIGSLRCGGGGFRRVISGSQPNNFII